jgi:hypothetical protein
MPETLYFRMNAVDVRPLDDGLFAILNNETVDDRRYFELVSLRVSPAAPVSNNTAGVGRAGSLSIKRITALTGGDTVTPIKVDTGDASLPSQVSVVNDPDSVTATDIFRRIADAPAYSNTIANTQFSSRTYGGSMMTHQKSHMADIWRGGESADVESIILREGQGIGIFQDTYGSQHSMQTAAVITNTATNATYICRSTDLSTDRRLGEANFAIFNGAGSGVVLAVKLWVLPMDGEAVLTPALRLCRISGIGQGGDTVAPILPDTSKTAPSALVVKSGPLQPRISGEWQADYYETHGLAYQGAGVSLGAWNTAQLNAGTLNRALMTNIFPAIGETKIGMQWSALNNDLLFDAEPGKGILLKPGDGLGLVSGTTVAIGGTQANNSSSTFINFDIEAVVLHYPPTVSGTYPPVGDVDQGVLYGPNGNDYTGTLEQPIPADVKLGVSYGANGTEFTGTYSGGGGGNTYSKSRVVNKG